MKLNILGTEWEVSVLDKASDSRFDDCDGFCDNTTNEICVSNYKEVVGKPNSKKDLEQQKKKVIRHEIVHAFLFESGLAENSYWAQDEELVDWIAIQFPKMYKAMHEAEALP